MSHSSTKWQFCIDRGGTFTDCIGISPDGEMAVSKVFSSDQAPLEAIRKILQISPGDSFPDCDIRMGTTLGTNALLQRKGARFCLAITQGFGDILTIGGQQRPDIFNVRVKKHTPLYDQVIEIEERVSADGQILTPLNLTKTREQLLAVHESGIDSVAIVLLHGYQYPHHEETLRALAQEIGFSNISCSNQICPEIGLVSRGDTTSVDAYLTPVLRRYLLQLKHSLPNSTVYMIQSNGGLIESTRFRGHHSILSGPAGGVVACADHAKRIGIQKIIGLDMGGTSTDVFRYDGYYDRVYETIIEGTRIRSPMMNIHTVAAGGGSVCRFTGGRFTVGPESAGATPGPLCYGHTDDNGKPIATDLTVTDVNFFLGRLFTDNFPIPLHREPVVAKIQEIQSACRKQGFAISDTQIAEGFLEVANMTMARAIKDLLVSRGHDPREYGLCCFGGASGQHACAIASILDIDTIIIPYLSGVFSASGISQANLIQEESAPVINLGLTEESLAEVNLMFDNLIETAVSAIRKNENPGQGKFKILKKLELQYKNTHTSLTIPEPGPTASAHDYIQEFTAAYERLYGYSNPEAAIEIVQCRVEVSLDIAMPRPLNRFIHHDPLTLDDGTPFTTVTIEFNGKSHETPIFRASVLAISQSISGPAIILDDTATIVIEPDFKVHIDTTGNFIIRRKLQQRQLDRYSEVLNPVTLEVFHNLFMSVAEQMGQILNRTAISPSIRERMDFSCAVYDQEGRLVSNAPHIPVHLGSMGLGVKQLLKCGMTVAPGDVFITNDPFNGGSHLPVITVITPVFLTGKSQTPSFYVTSRAHHGDIGGITPGSIPALSTTIEEEGIFISMCKIVDAGEFQTAIFNRLFTQGPYPPRNPKDNLADLWAQIAANESGVNQLRQLSRMYGVNVVRAYMTHIQNNSSQQVLHAIRKLQYGEYKFTDYMDDGSPISATILVDRDSMAINFAGTGPMTANNLNAPRSIMIAAVLYVIRALISEKIPINEGCLDPVIFLVPNDCLINPTKPCAVAAGNVETSQRIVDVLFGALKTCAASQGTMNNISFGNDRFHYYETICGGVGASENYDGADTVHTHMTNTRITDPEIVENQYPVRITQFSIRRNSGGKGKYKGGDGAIRIYEFLEEVNVSILSDRRLHAPYGLNGGQPAEPGLNIRIKEDGSRETLPGRATYVAKPNERLEIHTPGGGGWGERLQ